MGSSGGYGGGCNNNNGIDVFGVVSSPSANIYCLGPTT